MAKELRATCSVESYSLLNSRDPKTLKSFTWQDLQSQLQKTAPLTTNVLNIFVTSGRPAKSRRGPQSANVMAIVGMCSALLLRARSRNMNLIQRLISVILYGGHANKQVSWFCDW